MMLRCFQRNAHNRRCRTRHEQQSGAGEHHYKVDQRFLQSAITITVMASDNPIPSNRFPQIRIIVRATRSVSLSSGHGSDENSAIKASGPNTKKIMVAATPQPTRLDLERAGLQSATSKQTTPNKLANAGTDLQSAERHSCGISTNPSSGNAASHGAYQRRAGDRIGHMAIGSRMEGQMPPQKMTAEARKLKETSPHMSVAPQDGNPKTPLGESGSCRSQPSALLNKTFN